jgi:peptide/nickel transport system permease protein
LIAYLARRIVQALIVVLGVTIIVFLLLHLLPGGPARAILGERANKFAIAAFNREYGLDKPIPVQYWFWLDHLLHGDLGFSLALNQSVDSLLLIFLPRTALLVGTATVLAIVIGAGLGVLQAVRRNDPDDYVLTSLAFVFYAMPPFFLGLVLIIVFSVILGWLPPTGPSGSAPFFSQFTNLVLPMATLALPFIAFFSRYMRSAMLENLIQDYVRTAHSKGVPSGRILFRHVFRNALLPLITLVGFTIPWIVGGALIVEALFNYPGIGLLFWNACEQQDYPVMLGVTLIVGLATVLGSLTADILYAVIDPRIRYI